MVMRFRSGRIRAIDNEEKRERYDNNQHVPIHCRVQAPPAGPDLVRIVRGEGQLNHARYISPGILRR